VAVAYAAGTIECPICEETVEVTSEDTTVECECGVEIYNIRFAGSKIEFSHQYHESDWQDYDPEDYDDTDFLYMFP
jgi:uncharacterized Zn finger protein (UPF0148 family)